LIQHAIYLFMQSHEKKRNKNVCLMDANGHPSVAWLPHVELVAIARCCLSTGGPQCSFGQIKRIIANDRSTGLLLH